MTLVTAFPSPDGLDRNGGHLLHEDPFVVGSLAVAGEPSRQRWLAPRTAPPQGRPLRSGLPSRCHLWFVQRSRCGSPRGWCFGVARCLRCDTEAAREPLRIDCVSIE